MGPIPTSEHQEIKVDLQQAAKAANTCQDTCYETFTFDMCQCVVIINERPKFPLELRANSLSQEICI